MLLRLGRLRRAARVSSELYPRSAGQPLPSCHSAEKGQESSSAPQLLAELTAQFCCCGCTRFLVRVGKRRNSNSSNRSLNWKVAIGTKAELNASLNDKGLLCCSAFLARLESDRETFWKEQKALSLLWLHRGGKIIPVLHVSHMDENSP